jgi:hypothetical protein
VTYLQALLHTACCSLPLLLPVALSAEDRCAAGPTGPHDVAYLTDCRPEPVSAPEKDAVVRTLPLGGTLTTFTRAQRARIEAMDAVLRFHGRESAYETRFVRIPQATFALYRRAVLLVSVPALDLLNAEEVQAVVAHEIGHEYLMADWTAARAVGDEGRLRQVEVACDAIAALTLGQLRIPVARLASAIAKLDAYNHARFGILQNATGYPSVRERRRLLARFTR